MASTIFSPSRRRVRNVDDMPRRFLSRNSTRLNCEPTETISAAPFSCAISIAMSWLVPGRGHDLVRQPEPLESARARARGRRRRRGRRARRRSAASPRTPSPCRRRSCRAGSPPRGSRWRRRRRRRARAARRGCRGAARCRSALVVDAADDDQRRPVAEVGVEARQLDLAGRAARCSSTMCSTVLRANASSASPISRAAPLGRGAAPRRVLQVAARRAARRGPSTSPPRSSTRSPSLTRVEERVVGQVDERDARLDEQQRPHVRVVAGRRGAAVERRAPTPAAIRSSAETRSRLWWSITAISPGRRRLTSSFVLRPSRTGPATAGRVPGCARPAPSRPSLGPRTRRGGRRCRTGAAAPAQAAVQQLARVRALRGARRRSSAPSIRTSSPTTCGSASSTTVVQRRLGVRVLVDREVPVGERGDLRQVRDAQHLAAARRARAAARRRRARSGRRCPRRSRRTRASPATPSLATPSSASITRESSPPEAISRSGAGRHAGVRREQDLDGVGARGARLGSLSTTSKRRALHRQLGELLAHGALRAAAPPSRARRAAPARARRARPRAGSSSAAPRLERVLGAAQLVVARAAALGVLEHRLDRAAVLSLEPLEHGQALLDGVERARLGLERPRA